MAAMPGPTMAAGSKDESGGPGHEESDDSDDSAWGSKWVGAAKTPAEDSDNDSAWGSKWPGAKKASHQLQDPADASHPASGSTVDEPPPADLVPKQPNEPPPAHLVQQSCHKLGTMILSIPAPKKIGALMALKPKASASTATRPLSFLPPKAPSSIAKRHYVPVPRATMPEPKRPKLEVPAPSASDVVADFFEHDWAVVKRLSIERAAEIMMGHTNFAGSSSGIPMSCLACRDSKVYVGEYSLWQHMRYHSYAEIVHNQPSKAARHPSVMAWKLWNLGGMFDYKQFGVEVPTP